MKRLLKEPLVHFVVLGALLFGAYAWLNRGQTEYEPRLVRITAQEIGWIKETWARQHLHPPSEAELKGLVATYIKEELLSREARELGLDESDTIVRRRLAQKMEFLVQDTARAVEPTEAELRRLYEAHAERFQRPARVSFTLINFKTETAARQGLEELPGGNASELGDRIMLEREYAGADERTVAGLLGREFADRLFAFELGTWQGPVKSAYGFHLVLVSEREAARLRPFDEVRAQVLDDWHREQQEKADKEFFAGLLKKYDVVADDSVQPLVNPVALVQDVIR